MAELVSNYSEVVDNVRRFNDGLTSNRQLQAQLPYFRAWYYVPELDAVAPSKFIGYKDMTADLYVGVHGDELDGRWTEPKLKVWFGVLGNATPEQQYVASVVEALLRRYGKRINRVARYNAPRGWTSDRVATPMSPLADVFWRAYKTLRLEDQERLAKRIAEDRPNNEDKEFARGQSNLAKT